MGAILILVSLLILLLGVLFGFLRGTVRSAIRLGTLVFALLLALLLANALSSVLGGLFAPLVEDLFFSGEGMADLIRTNPEMPDLILVMARMLAAPILFLVCYMLLKLITFIGYAILCKAVGIGKGKIGSRFGGAGIGLVIGLIGLIVLSVPVVGYTRFASDTLTTLESSALLSDGEGDSELAQYNAEYVQPLAEAPIVGLGYTILGDTLFDSLTTAEWNGEDLSLREEWFTILGVLENAGQLTERPVEEFGATESQAVHGMVTDIGHSRVLSYLGGNTLSGMATAWLNGDAFLGMEAPAMEDGNAQLLVNGLLRVFATTNPQQFAGDLAFFADFFDLLVEYRMFSLFAGGNGDGDFIEQMTSSGFLEAAYALINNTPRMQPVSKAIADVGMNILVAELGLPEEYKENYGKLMDDMSGALHDSVTEEGTIDVTKLHESLNDAFADSEVEIPESAAEIIANGLSELFTPEELKTLDAEQITDRLIERFTQVEDVTELIPEGALPDGVNPEDLIPEGGLPEGLLP